MKQNFEYQNITCKNALNRIDSFLPYHWDLNVYRGCEHQCCYCYAQYSHRYLDDTDFFHHIYVKENIATILKQKLSSKNWKREVINLGGVTDSYQPAEKIYQIMPEILKILIQYKTPAIISTKSSLILRDIELLKELNRVAGLQIAITITTLDKQVSSLLEPNASSIQERIKTIKALKEAGLCVGWHLMPIIPYITATKKNLHSIFKMAKECNVDYMITSLLNLKGNTRKHFFAFVQEHYSYLYPKIRTLYHDKEMKKEYKKKLSMLLYQLENEYQVNRNYMKYVPKIETNLQLCLF